MRIIKLLTHPLIIAIIHSSIIIAIIFLFFVDKEVMRRTIYEDDIASNIKKIINRCGNKYMLYWGIIENRVVYTKDIFVCKGNKPSCAIRDKASHDDFFNQKHLIDKASLEMVKKMKNGESILFKNHQEFSIYPIIDISANKTQANITSMALSITKGFASNLYYVFALSNINNDLNVCNLSTMKLLVEELSLYAEKRL